MAVLDTKNARENMKHEKKTAKAVQMHTDYIKYARSLAGNDKEDRDRALQRLGKWLKKIEKSNYSLQEDELLVLWKGLFYSMWMSDKLLIQEECAENIAHLIHKLQDNQLIFFKCGLKTLCNEWFGIDQLRLDKFMMFARRLMRQALVVIRNNEWKFEYVKQFQDILNETVLNPQPGGFLGLTMHISDIYWEEISKISQGKITQKTINELLLPFLHYIVALDNACDIQNFSENIFRYLIKQTDLHLEYEEKFAAWRNMGYPGGDIRKLQKQVVDDDDDEDDDATDKDVSLGEQVLDPRAGSVHVTLPQLHFNANQIASLLEKYKYGKGSNKKSRAYINKLIENFKLVAKNIYPYGIKKVNLDDGKLDIKKATKELMGKFEVKNKRKNRKRKRKDNDDVVADKQDEVNIHTKTVKCEEVTANKSKKKKIQDAGPLSNNTKRKSDEDLALQQTKKPNLNSSNFEEVLNNFEMAFTRNSGVWHVYSADDIECSNITVDNHSNGGSSKKVKIDLKMNQSQEIDEHEAQLRSSPAIPFDANRKPRKTLLKPNAASSPISAIYRKQLLEEW
ncbi:PREDICTED: ribosomal RNA processing protein 1 homolog [Nicrophorus vespilloides]|uniref:Ribosomal RNA processing protein 1 homolog n=1 Tax=Nicrophorus vespilloides TaxID=110193 RepID=A0ABM1MS55_NICVS|nr:PREDICTED: ribosomal RNA processing protein 1 homolog [Nicrophorus vespilloides]